MKQRKNRTSKSNRNLQDEQILKALEEVAEKLSIKVHYERMKAFEFRVQDGQCIVNGESKIFIDSRHPVKEKVSILAQELGKFDLEQIYIPPLLREKIFLFPGLKSENEKFEKGTPIIEGNA